MRPISDFASDLEDAMKAGMRKGVEAVLADAVKRSSGPFSSAQLARMDHPFATRHGSPLLDPGTINRQTGAFVRDWRIESAGSWSLSVVNRNPVADFLKEGTRFMVARPIQEAIEAEALPLIEAAIEAEIERVLKQNYS